VTKRRGREKRAEGRKTTVRAAYARRRGPSGGFTLIEIMVAVALTVILIGVMALVFAQSKEIMQRTDLRMQSFRGAQLGMDILKRDLTNFYPETRPGLALSISSTIYDPDPGNGAPLYSDTLQFTTFRDDPATNERIVERVRYYLENTGALAPPILRRESALVTYSNAPTVAPTLGPPVVSDIADRVIDFGVEFSMDASDPVAPANPQDRLRPQFRRGVAPGGPTDSGEYFYYTDVNGILQNANLEAELRVPRAMVQGRFPFDFVRPFSAVQLGGNIPAVPYSEYTIREIDHVSNPVVVRLVETPPVSGNANGVAYTAFALPSAIRVTIGTSVRGTPRGSLVETIEIPHD